MMSETATKNEPNTMIEVVNEEEQAGASHGEDNDKENGGDDDVCIYVHAAPTSSRPTPKIITDPPTEPVVSDSATDNLAGLPNGNSLAVPLAVSAATRMSVMAKVSVCVYSFIPFYLPVSRIAHIIFFFSPFVLFPCASIISH